LSVLDEKTVEYKVVVTQLDGSNRVEIGEGDWPSLSPDGSTVVYTAVDGLHIYTMGTQEDKVVPGTAKYDRNALWAPDGKRFVFTRGLVSGLIGAPGPYNIMLADWDGSNVRPLTNRPGANQAMAWTLDGSKIIYSQDSTDGSSDMALDVQTGFSSPIFTTSHSFSSLSLSPDGTREVFEEMLPGDVYGISVSNLDGSNKHLIVTGGSVNVTMPMWSPDGKWVIASAHDLQIPNSFSKLVLINPDTCGVVALPAMSGYVYTWLK
jgi:Tol biopolymer transport system component